MVVSNFGFHFRWKEVSPAWQAPHVQFWGETGGASFFSCPEGTRIEMGRSLRASREREVYAGQLQGDWRPMHSSPAHLRWTRVCPAGQGEMKKSQLLAPKSLLPPRAREWLQNLLPATCRHKLLPPALSLAESPQNARAKLALQIVPLWSLEAGG